MIRISVYGLDQRLWRIDQMPCDSARPLMNPAYGVDVINLNGVVHELRLIIMGPERFIVASLTNPMIWSLMALWTIN